MYPQVANTQPPIDMPPSLFECGDGDMDLSMVPAYSELPIAVEDAAEKAIRHSLKIARAISGATEVRLLVEKCTGKNDVFILEEAELSPYNRKPTRLMRGKKPMSSKLAHEAYDQKVLEMYPAEVLRNGKKIARHLVLK